MAQQVTAIRVPCAFQALSRRHSLFVLLGLADLADQQYDANHTPPHCPVARGDLKGARDSGNSGEPNNHTLWRPVKKNVLSMS